MPSPSKLRCELCGDIIEAPDWVNAVEVVTERDAKGTIVAVRDGYQVGFHEVCWRQQRSRAARRTGSTGDRVDRACTRPSTRERMIGGEPCFARRRRRRSG